MLSAEGETGIDSCEPETPLSGRPKVDSFDRKTLDARIREAVAERDTYWHEQLRVAGEAQRRHAEVAMHDVMRKKFLTLQKQNKLERDELIDMNEVLKKTVTEYEAEIKRLQEQTEELKTEVETGKRIIHQFSQLMNDKVSSVCRYCRRSGTLPPVSFL